MNNNSRSIVRAVVVTVLTYAFASYAGIGAASAVLVAAVALLALMYLAAALEVDSLTASLWQRRREREAQALIRELRTWAK